jgi:hypothetical protein
MAFARVFASDTVVVLLVTTMRWLPNCASAVWLLAPAISLIRRDDVGEDPFLLGTMSMAFLMSFPSWRRHFGISGVDLGSCLGPSTIRLWRQGASALVAFCESDLLSFLPIYFPLF